MDRTTRLRINSPHVVHQTIDGEVVVINLESGSYYSLNDVAAEVWALLESGSALGEIAETLGSRYDASADAIARALEAFVTDLHAERLLVPTIGAAVSLPSNGATAGGTRRSFTPPLLEKYTDMQDLLLVDPIHEVDDLGWPGTKTNERDD